MRRSGCSLALRSPKLAVLSGSLRKTVADVHSARWNGVTLATPKRPTKTTPARRRFATHKNQQSSQNQPPLATSHSQVTTKKVRRKPVRRSLALNNLTSSDNPLMASIDSAASLHRSFASVRSKRSVARLSGSRDRLEFCQVQLPRPSIRRGNSQQRRHTLTSQELADELSVMKTEPASWMHRTAKKRPRPGSVADVFQSSFAYLC